jgi:hypothetical protein
MDAILAQLSMIDSAAARSNTRRSRPHASGAVADRQEVGRVCSVRVSLLTDRASVVAAR